MTSEEVVTLLVMILGLITAVVYLGKGYFEWDTARLKMRLLRKKHGDDPDDELRSMDEE